MFNISYEIKYVRQEIVTVGPNRLAVIATVELKDECEKKYPVVSPVVFDHARSLDGCTTPFSVFQYLLKRPMGKMVLRSITF